MVFSASYVERRTSRFQPYAYFTLVALNHSQQALSFSENDHFQDAMGTVENVAL